MVIVGLILILFGLSVIMGGLAMINMFADYCIPKRGPAWAYVLAPVGITMVLLGVMIIYHTVRVFFL